MWRIKSDRPTPFGRLEDFKRGVKFAGVHVHDSSKAPPVPTCVGAGMKVIKFLTDRLQIMFQFTSYLPTARLMESYELEGRGWRGAEPIPSDVRLRIA